MGSSHFFPGRDNHSEDGFFYTSRNCLFSKEDFGNEDRARAVSTSPVLQCGSDMSYRVASDHDYKEQEW